MKNHLLLIAIALLLVAAPGATALRAQSDIPRNQTLIIDAGKPRIEAPENWNPFAPGTGVTLESGLLQVAAEPMFLLNYESGKIEPYLGESMDHNAAQDVWTLHIRKGITWSDGVAFNADDVVFTAKVFADHAADFGAGWVREVKSTEKVDDLTVRYTLVKADPFFQLNTFASKIVSSQIIVPKHIFEGKDAATFTNFDLAKGLPLGTGPYKLVKANQTETTWDLDPNYWGAKTSFTTLPAPKRIIFTTAGTEEAASAQLIQQKVDSSASISAPTFASLAPKNPALTGWFPKAPYAWFDPCERNLELNLSKAPFNDRDIRYALNYAINREQVVAIAYGGNSLPSRSPFPSYGGLNRFLKLADDAGLYKKYLVGTYNADAAAKLLTAKGYTKGGDGFYQKDGKALAFDITTADYPEIVAVGQVVAEQLQEFGINATQRKQDPGVFDTALHNGTLDAWIGWQMCGSVSEPFSSLNSLSSQFLVPAGTRADSNFWKFDNADLSKTLDAWGQLALDDPQQDKQFLAAYEIYLRELPVIPVAQAIKLIAFNTTYWTNWPSVENNYIHPPTWWQSAAKIIHALKPSGK